MKTLPVGANESREIYLRLGSQTIHEMRGEIIQFREVCGFDPAYVVISHHQYVRILESNPKLQLGLDPRKVIKFYGYIIKIE